MQAHPLLPASDNALFPAVAEESGEVVSTRLESFLTEQAAPSLRQARDAHARLEAGISGRAAGALAQALGTLQASLAQVEFTSFRKGGWLGRATPQGRIAAARFVAQCRDVMSNVEAAKICARALVVEHQAHAAASGMTTDRIQAESAALDEMVVQGAAQLGQSWRDLSKRKTSAQESGSGRRLAAVSQQLDACAVRLKQLHGICGASKESSSLALGLLEQREGFLQTLQRVLDEHVDAWAEKLAGLACCAEDPRLPIAGLPAAVEAHKALVRALGEVDVACIRLQHAEQVAAASLSRAQKLIEAGLASTPAM